MRHVTIKGLLAKKGRLALTAFAILLGVAFLAAAGVLTTTIKDGAEEMFGETAERTDVEVRGPPSFASDPSSDPTRDPLPAEMVMQIRSIPGVEAAAGWVEGYAEIADADGTSLGSISTTSVGGSADGIGTVSPFVLRDGRVPAGDGEVVIDVASARDKDLAVGDRVTVQFAGPAEPFTVVGTVGFGDLDGVSGTTFALFDLATAQRVLDKDGALDEVRVAAADGIQPAELARRIDDALAGGAVVTTTAERIEERSEATAGSLSIVDNGLTAFALIALAVAGFLIVNTFTIVVAQRTRELALLRALGASRKQVRFSVLAEAAATGLIASLAGTMAGIGIAAGMRAGVEASGVELPGSGIIVGPANVAVPVLVGTVLTVVAAYLPARRAAKLAPIAAIRDVVQAARTKRIRYVFGGILIAAGMVLSVMGLPLLLVGAALLAPLAISPFARVLGRGVGRFGGLPVRLGHENAARNPRRTASTASALMIGLALVVGLTIASASALSTFGDALEAGVAADFIVDSEQTKLSPELTERLAARPELGIVSPMRFGEFEIADAPTRAEPLTGLQSASAVDPATIGEVSDLGYSDGSLERMLDGGVMISEALAADHGLRVGDVLTMRFAHTGEQKITIDGTYADDTLEDQGFMLSQRDFEANYTDLDAIRILVEGAPGVDKSDARAAVDEVVSAFPSAQVRSNAEYRDAFSARLDIALAIVAVVLGLAVVIAVLGVINTLALSIVERTRELGLLRAVGMTRAQMRSMIRSEAITIALIGGVLGVVVGMPIGISLSGVLDTTGITLPWLRLLLFLVFAVVAGVAAALLPARRAARLDVLTALSHE